MKINDSVNSKVDLVDKMSSGKPVSGDSGKSQSASTTSKSGENVTLSAMSVQLQAMASDMGADGVFDAEKVEAIKSAIASGQFKVDSEKVADGLLDTVKDLLKK